MLFVLFVHLIYRLASSIKTLVNLYLRSLSLHHFLSRFVGSGVGTFVFTPAISVAVVRVQMLRGIELFMGCTYGRRNGGRGEGEGMGFHICLFVNSFTYFISQSQTASPPVPASPGSPSKSSVPSLGAMNSLLVGAPLCLSKSERWSVES